MMKRFTPIIILAIHVNLLILWNIGMHLWLFPCLSVSLIPLSNVARTKILGRYHHHNHRRRHLDSNEMHVISRYFHKYIIRLPMSATDGASEDPTGKENLLNSRKSVNIDRSPRAHITPAHVECIKSMADIVSVVESYSLPQFTRTGPTKATCLCPFHDDNNPSMSIDGDRKMYKCFSCGAAGDVFNFVREYDRVVSGGVGDPDSFDNEKMSFPAAVYFVAREFTTNGLELLPEAKTRSSKSHNPLENEVLQKKKERLKLANSAAAEFYCSCLMKLPSAGSARFHLNCRGISPDTVRQFVLGYAPDVYFGIEKMKGSRRGEGSLVSRLKSLNFTPDEIVEAGLATRKMSIRKKDLSSSTTRKTGRNDDETASNEYDYSLLMDRFRGRLMVPIFDGDAVIGFGGRILDEGESVATKQDASSIKFKAAKYINSPESPIFSKKNTLFGASSLSRKNKTLRKTLVLVEGYFDALSLHDIEIDAVCTMGTAISLEQLEKAARLVGHGGILVLCLDSDDAGVNAMERLCAGTIFWTLLKRVTVEVKVAQLPNNMKDPSDFIESKRKKSESYAANSFEKEIIDKSISWSDWYLARVLVLFNSTTKENEKESFSSICDKITSFLANVENPAERTRQTFECAKSLAERVSESSASTNEALRVQLESDLLDMTARKAKVRENLDRRVLEPDQKRRLSNGYVEKDRKRLMTNELNKQNGKTNELNSSLNEKRNSLSMNKGNAMVDTRQRKRIQKKPAKMQNVMPHFNGFPIYSEDDRKWLGLDKFSFGRKDKLYLGDFSKIGPKKPIYFNSNEYLGNDIDSIHTPLKEDTLDMIVRTEESILRSLIDFSPARRSLSTTIRHSMSELVWSSPSRKWLFEWLLEEDTLYEGEQLRNYLCTMKGIPTGILSTFPRREMPEKDRIVDSINGATRNAQKVVDVSMSPPTPASREEEYIDPSDFDIYVDLNENVSLEDLELIYESNDNDDQHTTHANAIVVSDSYTNQNDQNSAKRDGVKSPSKVDSSPVVEEENLEFLFEKSKDNDQQELHSLEACKYRSELSVQESIAFLLRSHAKLRREEALLNFSEAVEQDEELEDRDKLSRLNEDLTIATEEAIELENASRRISSNMQHVALTSSPMNNAKSTSFEEDLSRMMDEFYESLPDDDDYYGRSVEEETDQMEFHSDSFKNRKEAGATMENEVHHIEEDAKEEMIGIDVDDLLGNWKDIVS